jgi:hypothetical protein
VIQLVMMAKLDQVRLESEPHNPSSLAFAADVVNALYEFTKSQLSFPAMGFHGPKYNPGDSGAAMGSSPHLRFIQCLDVIGRCQTV